MNTLHMRWLVAAVFVALLVGCGSPAQVGPGGAPLPTIAPVVIPLNGVGGGTLIMALGAQDPNTLDPALVGDTTSAFVVRQIFSGLVRLDNTLEVQPDLAEAWDISQNKLEYTFHLRADARFQDGSPLTADDVVYALERATDPQLAQFLPARTYLSDIVGVREKLAGQANRISGLNAPDERTVSIAIDAPKTYFLAKLAHPTSFVVDQAAVEAGGADWTEQPNGSGPFIIEEWQHDELLLLGRNFNFYREPAKLDRVRMLMGAAANNALVQYEQGDLDVVGVPTYALARVEDESNPLSSELVSVPQLSLQYIGLNVAQPPFDDPKVRQAFALLFDRVKLAEVSLRGAAQPAYGIMPPGLPGYDPAIAPVVPNLERAKTLLAESRYGGAQQLPPIVAYGGWGVTLRDLAQEALGITIEVRNYEDYGAYFDALDQGQFQVFSSGWVADYPDPENFVDLLFRSGSGENHMAYSSPAVDELLDEAAVEPDEARRHDLYREAERRILADAPVIPLYHDVDHTLIKPYVRGLEVTSMGILDLAVVELLR